MPDNKLQIHIGFDSQCGLRDNNEDYVAAFVGDTREYALHGILAAIADGMGGHAGGREAAEITVREFIDSYYSMPATLGVERAAAQAIGAINQWVFAQAHQDPNLSNMATTFSALILRHRQAHIIHIGDTRIYRLRDQVLEQLTADHILKHPDFQHAVCRGIGLEKDVHADYMVLDLRLHDRFLLCSDGVHGALAYKHIWALLLENAAPKKSAERLVDDALQTGSKDNVTAQVLDIVSLPPADFSVIEMTLESLAITPIPKIGTVVDGFAITDKLYNGRYSCLFIATDTLAPQEHHQVVLKFPQLRIATDMAYRQAFMREAWIAARTHSPWLVDVIALTPGRQTRLYSVMPYYQGETLTQRLQRQPAVKLDEGIDIGIKLAKAVYSLNRLRIIHRDIKPDNVILLQDGKIKLFDLGIARLPGIDENFPDGAPGTPSYMAPEFFTMNCTGNEKTEIYALGVTLFQLFTKHYPYGEVEPFSRPRFAKQASLNDYRSDLPAWLDTVLAKAIDVDADKRFSDSIELAFELETGLAQGPKKILESKPFIEQNPVLFWKIVSLMLGLSLIVSAILT